MDTFGKRLTAARLAAFERTGKQMSQVELSLLVGMTKAVVSAYEGDAYPPTIETAGKLADALGVRRGWLTYGEEPRYPAEGDQAPPPLMTYRKAETNEERSARERKTAKKSGQKKRGRAR